MASSRRFLIRHVGNMGDLVFFIPPVLETLKRRYPDCHITFVTAWGYKQKGWKPTIIEGRWGLPRVARRAKWGERNQGGFSIALMMTNPHIDQLVHWHDTRLDREATTCCEEGRCFPTWNAKYYEEQKKSGEYDAVYELDFGLTIDDNPIQKMYAAIGLPEENFSYYRLYFTEKDESVAAAVMHGKPRPRIVVLESLAARSTRGWDSDRAPDLEAALKKSFGAQPLWFGANHIPTYRGKSLTLRQNIATLRQADVVIGVMSGPLHFAAAVGVPTLTLYSDQPLHRAAPAYFLNEYIADPAWRHRTLIGAPPHPLTFLKSDVAPTVLSAAERKRQKYRSWLSPGRQSTKSGLAAITVDEVMTVLYDMLKKI